MGQVNLYHPNKDPFILWWVARPKRVKRKVSSMSIWFFQSAAYTGTMHQCAGSQIAAKFLGTCLQHTGMAYWRVHTTVYLYFWLLGRKELCSSYDAWVLKCIARSWLWKHFNEALFPKISRTLTCRSGKFTDTIEMAIFSYWSAKMLYLAIAYHNNMCQQVPILVPIDSTAIIFYSCNSIEVVSLCVLWQPSCCSSPQYYRLYWTVIHSSYWWDLIGKWLQWPYQYRTMGLEHYCPAMDWRQN